MRSNYVECSSTNGFIIVFALNLPHEGPNDDRHRWAYYSWTSIAENISTPFNATKKR